MLSMARFLELLDTPRVQIVLIVASVLGAIIGLDTLARHLTTDPLADVHAYYDAGARLNAGQPLYDQPAGTDDADFYRYPPLLAIAFRPLALLPFETAALIWEAFLVALFVMTIYKTGTRNKWTWIVLGWLAAPFAWSLAIGQAQIAVTYFVTLGTPFGIAMAAHLKLLPALVAVYWLGREDWRSLGMFLAWGLGLLALSFVLEPAGTIAYLGFPDLNQVGNVENRSLYAVSILLWGVFSFAFAVIAWRFARTRVGWLLAVAFSVLVNPRLLMYQLATLFAAVRPPDQVASEAEAEPVTSSAKADDDVNRPESPAEPAGSLPSGDATPPP
jgi:glycosyl transferase family 87